jgi:hypothetical protein
MLVRTGNPDAEMAVKLADLFCRQSRRRVDQLFRELDSNDDGRMYQTARAVLDGEYLWMEDGIVGLQENLSLPDFYGVGAPAPDAVGDAVTTSEQIGI